jgi:perosamine synthetase
MDADSKTWQMDAGKVERFLSEECAEKDNQCFNKKTSRRVRAILPVHILGSACEIDRLAELARRHHLKMVEDACEGMGVYYRGKHVGTVGDIGVFSFNGNKIVTAGGGGALVTSNPRYAKYTRYLTAQAKDDEVEYIHNEVGYNYRLTDIGSACSVRIVSSVDFVPLRMRPTSPNA